MTLRAGPIVLVLLSAPSTGCTYSCNENGCGAGFYWTGRETDGGALQPASYRITLVIEDARYVIDCSVTEELTLDGTECGTAQREAGATDFDVWVRVLDDDDDSVPAYFLAEASEREEDGSLRGPRHVGVEVHRSDEPIHQSAYDLEYVRDEEYWGDARCGFCDLAESREAQW